MFWAVSNASTSTRLFRICAGSIFLVNFQRGHMETLTQTTWSMISKPGDVIAMLMTEQAWTTSHLTHKMQVDESVVDGLLEGTQRIDSALADKLRSAFWMPASFWMHLDANYLRYKDVPVDGAWDKEEDLKPLLPQFVDATDVLNKKLIAVLASLLQDFFEDRSRKIRALASYPASESAVELLAQIGVLVKVETDKYEFAPGFDPSTGGWT
jgi:plasmid maintenance system antidote protein VapI